MKLFLDFYARPSTVSIISVLLLTVLISACDDDTGTNIGQAEVDLYRSDSQDNPFVVASIWEKTEWNKAQPK